MYSLEKDSGDFFGSITYLYPYFLQKNSSAKLHFAAIFFIASLPVCQTHKCTFRLDPWAYSCTVSRADLVF